MRARRRRRLSAPNWERLQEPSEPEARTRDNLSPLTLEELRNKSPGAINHCNNDNINRYQLYHHHYKSLSSPRLGCSPVTQQHCNHTSFELTRKLTSSNIYKGRRRTNLPIIVRISILFYYLTLFSHDNLRVQQASCQRSSNNSPRPLYNTPRPSSLQQIPAALSISQQQTARSSGIPEIVSLKGGTITKDKNVTLSKQNNPIVITRDIIIKRDAKLTIEAGTELLFERRRGIIVHGTLEILGESSEKVKMGLLRSQNQPYTMNEIGRAHV